MTLDISHIERLYPDEADFARQLAERSHAELLDYTVLLFRENKRLYAMWKEVKLRCGEEP